jgi:hypothetical protein
MLGCAAATFAYVVRRRAGSAGCAAFARGEHASENSPEELRVFVAKSLNPALHL